jgi:hypothetical protein
MGLASLPRAVVGDRRTYTTTQDDANAGSVTNTAVAQGTQPPTPTNPSPTPTTSGPSAAVVTIPPVAALTLKKTANLTSITTAGQQVEYSFLITNTGNVTVSSVGVNEGQFSGTGTLSKISCPTAYLAPGASEVCTATYVVTAQDIASGQLANTAVPTGLTPGQPKPVVGPPSTVVVPVVPPQGITVNTGAVGTTVIHGHADLRVLELIAGMLLIAMAGAGLLRRERRG